MPVSFLCVHYHLCRSCPPIFFLVSLKENWFSVRGLSFWSSSHVSDMQKSKTMETIVSIMQIQNHLFIQFLKPGFTLWTWSMSYHICAFFHPNIVSQSVKTGKFPEWTLCNISPLTETHKTQNSDFSLRSLSHPQMLCLYNNSAYLEEISTAVLIERFTSLCHVMIWLLLFFLFLLLYFLSSPRQYAW